MPIKNLTTRKAESIIEVIVASLVIIMAATSAAVLLTSALSSNVQTRDRMRAVNLAKEGIEAMINIRDTNLLKSGAFKEHCWNFLEDQTRINPQDNICNTKKLHTQSQFFITGTGSSSPYTLIQTTDFKWYIKKTGQTNLFNNAFKVPNANTKDPAEFFRKIDIEYLDYNASYPANPSPNGPPVKTADFKTGNVMKVTVTVGWRFKGQQKTIPLTVLLSNHRS